MAVSKLESEKDWQYFSEKTGNASAIDISALVFKELLIQTDVGGSGNKELFYIPKRVLSASNAWFRLGGYGANTSDAGIITIRATTAQIQLVTAYLNGQNYVTSTVVQVYYR